MTRQEAFNICWQRFVVDQKPKCETPQLVCMYSHKGNCCAVGALLSPELRKHLEGQLFPVTDMAIELDATPHLAEYQAIETGCTMNFLESLQIAHDQVVTCQTTLDRMEPEDKPQSVQFMKALSRVACKYGLTCGPCFEPTLTT